MLYPSTPISRPRANFWDERALAPSSAAHRSSTVNNSTLVSSSHRRHTLHYAVNWHQQQRHTHQQLSGLPAQVPRVTKLNTQFAGLSPSTSNRFSPSSRKHLAQRLYAASVPSNSPHSNRPPVPLFHSSGNLPQNQNQQSQHRRVMSTSSLITGEYQGHARPYSLPRESSENIPHANPTYADFRDLRDVFDTSAHQFVEELDSPAELTMLPHQPSFTAAESPAGQPVGTVSPKDLVVDASAPPSTSFTDLSTPPSFGSPGLFSHDASPMFPVDQELGPGHEEWESLFPANDAFALPVEDVSGAVPALPKTQPSASPMVRTSSSPMVRTASSPGESAKPSSGRSSTKHSSVAGVSSRRREKPLPPIVYDPDDPVAVKRARNTEAARKSRARKLARQESMERRIAELEKSLEEAEKREKYWKDLCLKNLGPAYSLTDPFAT